VLCSPSTLHAISNAYPASVLQQAATQERLPVRLTTTLISQRYCKEPGNDMSANLRMKLRLRYTNQAQQSVILYKYDNTISRAMVSKSPIDAVAQRYVWDLMLTTVTGGKEETIESATPGTSFTVLQPGQFYEAQEEITVFVRRGRNGKESDGLPPGDYFLQVVVSTWPESVSLAEGLRKRWQAIGLLWSGGLKSEPAAFRVDEKRREVNCHIE
jgi:hypothetical protein